LPQSSTIESNNQNNEIIKYDPQERPLHYCPCWQRQQKRKGWVARFGKLLNQAKLFLKLIQFSAMFLSTSCLDRHHSLAFFLFHNIILWPVRPHFLSRNKKETYCSHYSLAFGFPKKAMIVFPLERRDVDDGFGRRQTGLL